LKLKSIVVLLLLTSAFVLMSSPIVTSEPEETYERFGPRVNDILFNVYGSLTKEATGLEIGEIDFMDWAVPADKINSWLANPNLVMGDYSEAGWYEYDLNLQMWPIGHGSMRPEQGAEGGTAPTRQMDWSFPPSWDEGHYWINYTCQRDIDAKWFRKALAHLTNRDAIYGAFPGSLIPMETFIFPVISSWENPNAPKYQYSLDLAKAALDNGGFMDYDGDGVREYSKHVEARNAWKSGTGPVPPDVEEIPDIQMWIRSDDPPRQYAGRLLRDDLISIGVEVDAYEGSYGYCTKHAWIDYDYHIYTGGWGWSTTPDMYYEVWHSSKDIYPRTDGDNYNRYHSKEYDDLAYNFKTAPNMTGTKYYLDASQMMLHDDVPSIPLYTMAGYVAHRKYYGDFPGEQQYKGLLWEGFVNEKGYGYYGFNFGFSSINAHPQGYDRGGTLRHGLIEDATKLDPVDSESFYEWLVLTKIYEPLIVRDPYDVTKYVPWLASSFQEGTWNNSGRLASMVTVNLLPNILWHDNEPLTPEDVGFTYWYKREAMSVGEYSSVKEFDHSEIINATAIDIFFNSTSFLVLPWVSAVTIIPKHIWEAYPPTKPGDNTVPGSWSFDPEAADKLIGTGPFRCFKDNVVGRIDRKSREYLHLSANPYYFRKLLRPDFSGVVGGVAQPINDDRVDIWDFLTAAGHYGDTYPWPHPTWDPVVDVNKDLKIDLDDIMEIGVRFGDLGYIQGYPPYYFGG